MAVLAGDAGFARRAVPILVPHDLQLDAQVDGTWWQLTQNSDLVIWAFLTMPL